MRTITKRFLSGIILVTLAIAIPACSLPAPQPDVNTNQTQAAAAVILTQIANATPTLSPTPTSTSTPTATVDPVSAAFTSQAQTLIAVMTAASLTPLPPVLPTTYTLQVGEYPWCIARRYNVHPKDLLALNNLSSGMIYKPGLVLQIPQPPVARPFPPPRSRNPHPTVYTVPQANMTVYAVACWFGDVDPAAIMQVNALTSPILTFGMNLNIP